MNQDLNSFIDDIVSEIQDLYEGWEVPLFSEDIKEILLKFMFKDGKKDNDL